MGVWTKKKRVLFIGVKSEIVDGGTVQSQGKTLS